MKPFELLAERVIDGGRSVEITYLVAAFWRVTFQASIDAPFDGPERMTIGFASNAEEVDDAVASSEKTGGIDAALLRGVPLADARARLRRLRSEQRQIVDPVLLPKRFTLPIHWARFAQSYVAFATRTKHPTTALSEATGLPKSTVTGRVHWTRKRGYLSEATPTNLGELTELAKEVLKEHDERKRKGPRDG